MLEGGHSIAGAEAIGGVLRLEGFGGDFVQAVGVIASLEHTGSHALLVNMLIRTAGEGGNSHILAAAISTAGIGGRKSGGQNGTAVASAGIAEAGLGDLGRGRQAGTHGGVVGVPLGAILEDRGSGHAQTEAIDRTQSRIGVVVTGGATLTSFANALGCLRKTISMTILKHYNYFLTATTPHRP